MMVHIKKIVFKGLLFTLSAITVFGFFSCEKETDNVSKVTFFPEMTLLGEDTVSLVSPGPYVEAGALATENGASIPVSIEGTVDVNTPGLYILRYVAVNSDGYEASVLRYVAISPPEVENLDMSGTFLRQGNNVANNVTKISHGLYLMHNVGGVPPPSAFVLPMMAVLTSPTTISIAPQPVAVGGVMDCIEEAVTPDLKQFSYRVIHPNFGTAVRTFIKP